MTNYELQKHITAAIVAHYPCFDDMAVGAMTDRDKATMCKFINMGTFAGFEELDPRIVQDFYKDNYGG